MNEITQISAAVHEMSATAQEVANNAQLTAESAISSTESCEQGRGFAVVADEVRVLSQRTHSSTDEICQMIETLQRNTNSAVHSMDESKKFAQSSVDDANNATTALEDISFSIQQISDMAMQISNAAAEQRTVTDEVSQNIQSASDVSDQMSNEASNSQQLSEELREIATQLNNQVH